MSTGTVPPHKSVTTPRHHRGGRYGRPEIFVGRCDDITDAEVILLDVGQHVDGDGGKSKDEYVTRAAQVGSGTRIRWSRCRGRGWRVSQVGSTSEARMQVNWLLIGALGAALSVGLGAFGAHGLRSAIGRRGPGPLGNRSAVSDVRSLGLTAIGATRAAVAGPGRCGGCSAGRRCLDLRGTTVAALALGGPRWLGAVTPIGGALMIVGWVRLAWSALRSL